MTAHINAKKGDFAKTVLMPGDPLRAKFIAETFLENVKQVNDVRNMFMYTGTYNGKEISVAGSGMGQPSIGIYAYELFAFFGVERIIRIGSAGAYTADLELYDTILATEAFSDSNAFNRLISGSEEYVTFPSEKLNKEIETAAEKINIKLNKGRIHSSDVFYNSRPLADTVKETGNAIAVEMESAALFAVAKQLGKEAACLLTVSDNLVTKAETSSEERQTAFKDMMKVALELA